MVFDSFLIILINSIYIPLSVQLSSVKAIIRSVGRYSIFITSVHVAHSTALGL